MTDEFAGSDTSGRQPKPDNKCKKSRHYLDWIALFVSIAAVGFTWWNVEITRETARKQLRAYVFIKPYPFINKVLAGEFYNSTVYIRNGGQTPASQAILRMTIEVRKKSPPNSRKIFLLASKRQGFDTIIDPSTDVRGRGLIASNKKLSENELSAIVTGREMQFYVWGSITYKDIFEVIHHSFFCFLYYGRMPNNREGGMSASYKESCSHPNSD